jgi:hypothetical protein
VILPWPLLPHEVPLSAQRSIISWYSLGSDEMIFKRVAISSQIDHEEYEGGS